MYQYTVVIDRSWHAKVGEDKYFFKNFNKPEHALEVISTLAEGLKVHGIYEVSVEGTLVEKTVGFKDGRLTLI